MAKTIKQATKTQPIAASGLRLASRGNEIAAVAIAGIAEASLANDGLLSGTFLVPPESTGRVPCCSQEHRFLPRELQ